MGYKGGISDTASEGAGTLAGTTGSQQLAAAAKDRTALIVGNTHATNKVFLGLGETAVVNSGVYVPPATTHVVDYFSGRVNVVCSAGSTTIAFAEV